MIVLMCGGPHAGRVYDWPDPLPPKIVFPILKRVSGWLDDPLDTTVIEPTTTEYGRGSEADTAGGRVCAYHFLGEDKYRTARTFERLVPFGAPHGLQELEDKISVDWLLISSGFKP